jgi:hypothetical protein
MKNLDATASVTLAAAGRPRSHLAGAVRRLVAAIGRFWFLPSLSLVAWCGWSARGRFWDDPYIFLRYVRNFSAGHGLVYNVGEYFNGVSSPLYLYFLIAANAVLHDPKTSATLVCTFCLAMAAILGAHVLGRNVAERAGGALFVVGTTYAYSTFGMESALLVALNAAALLLHDQRRLHAVGAVLALLVLTRPESGLLAVVLFADYVSRERRFPPATVFIAPILLIAANMAFDALYYGSPVPATFGAKLGQARSGLWHGLFSITYLDYVRHALFGSRLFLMGGSLAAAVFGFYSLRRNRVMWLNSIYLALLALACVALRIPTYHWYLAPFMYFGALLVGVGLGAALQASWRLWRRRRAPLPVFIVTVCLVAVFAERTVALTIANPPAGENPGYRDMGDWLRTHTPAKASVAAVEIGTIGWYSERPLVDILGLTNRYNAAFLAKGDLHAWLSGYQPDYIVVHEPLWNFEASAECLLRDGAYAPVPEVAIPYLRLLHRAADPATPARIAVCARG